MDYFLKASVNTIFWKNTNLNISYNTRPGTLYTPIVSSHYNTQYNVYEPIYSEINSKQYENYSLINLGLSKNIKFKKTSSIVFLGLNNVLNIKNQRSFNYNKDYSFKEDVFFSHRTLFFGITLNW